MPITYVEIEDCYKPKTTSEEISVEVIIGNAGVGGYLIFLDRKLKAANKIAKLGKAKAVLGKRTIISATVPDVLDETNWTSLTVVVREGNSKTTYGPYSKEVANHLDTVSFTIQLVNQS